VGTDIYRIKMGVKGNCFFPSQRSGRCKPNFAEYYRNQHNLHQFIKSLCADKSRKEFAKQRCTSHEEFLAIAHEMMKNVDWATVEPLIKTSKASFELFNALSKGNYPAAEFSPDKLGAAHSDWGLNNFLAIFFPDKFSSYSAWNIHLQVASIYPDSCPPSTKYIGNYVENFIFRVLDNDLQAWNGEMEGLKITAKRLDSMHPAPATEKEFLQFLLFMHLSEDRTVEIPLYGKAKWKAKSEEWWAKDSNVCEAAEQLSEDRSKTELHAGGYHFDLFPIFVPKLEEGMYKFTSRAW